MNGGKFIQVLSFALFSWLGAASAAEQPVFPARDGPIPVTTKGVPHVQIGVEVNPLIYKALLERVAKLPSVEVRETVISLPGAKGFWINEDLRLARPDAIVGGREFAHVHPDGSLHASLPLETAVAAVNSGWADHHPWASSRPGWQGFVMIYTPLNNTELNIVMDLVLKSYQFVTGDTEIQSL